MPRDQPQSRPHPYSATSGTVPHQLAQLDRHSTHEQQDHGTSRTSRQADHQSRVVSHHGDRECTICSDDGHKINHHHFSTQNIRDFASKYQSGYLYFCMMCKANESTIRPSTRKVIITSSTLYNVWAKDLKLAIHVDIESIVGGRIRDLTRAIIMLYLKHPERLEILVVGGLNNIGDDQPAAQIIEEFRELSQTVQAHSEIHGHTKPSIVSISTILYAPKFCSLDVPSNSQDCWKPPAGFNNRRVLVETVNAAIKAMNLEAKVNYLKLHMEGIRIDKKKGKIMHKHNPKVPIWREDEVRKRLHLTIDYKVKVVRNAAKLFVGGLMTLGNWEPTD